MRKAVLVLALIGASFAGGAAINGQVLKWARVRLAECLGEEDPPVLSSRDLARGAIARSADPVEAEEEAISAAPRVPIAAADPDEEPDRGAGPAVEAELEPPAVEAPRDVTVPATPTSKPDPDVPALTPTPEGPRAEKESGPAPDATPRDDGATPTSPGPGTPAEKGEAPASASLPDLPPREPERIAQTAGASPPASPPADDAATWVEIRRRLQHEGVTRYWIEGEPGGPVRFRCVIPMVGQRSVAQQFEAEADDDLQAARMVLSRIVLWRATEAGAVSDP